MPFIPTTPIETTVHVHEDKPIDAYHIHGFSVIINPNEPTLTIIKIQWCTGWMDGGVFNEVTQHETMLSGSAVLQAIGTTVTPGNNRYDEIKTALWQLLIGAGEVEAGSIE